MSKRARFNFLAPVIVAAMAALAGCATNPPTEQMAVSRVAVTDAVSAGAADYAAVDLSHAQDELANANTAMGAQDYDRARRLAEAAEADANLAATRARSMKAQRAVAEVQESIRALRDEINRNAR
jgi:hypothetical protein